MPNPRQHPANTAAVRGATHLPHLGRSRHRSHWRCLLALLCLTLLAACDDDGSTDDDMVQDTRVQDVDGEDDTNERTDADTLAPDTNNPEDTSGDASAEDTAEDTAGTDTSSSDTGSADDTQVQDTTSGDTQTADTSGQDTQMGQGASLCPSSLPTGWIFCEDFETTTDPSSVFFEYDDDDGEFVIVDGEGASGTHSMQVQWQSGEVSAGRFNVAFGRNPIVYGGRPHYTPEVDYDEIYWRMRVKHQSGWPDVGPAKLNRVTSMAKDDWGQAMIAHLWSSGLVLLGDPASCVEGSTVQCSGYNDFSNLDWLGQMPGSFELFSSDASGEWHCVEGHVRLNTPGSSDGVFEFWIDGELQAERNDLNWRGSYEGHGVNLASFENYWNDGASAELRRWFDDIAIATVPIGCD